MTLALAALVLCSLSPPSIVTSSSLAQAKVQIIKGKKGNQSAATETSAQVVSPTDSQAQQNTAKSKDLDRKGAELDAKNKELSQREQAVQEKETSASEAEKKKAEQLKAQQKHIEKIGEANEKMMQQASDSLAGD